MSKLIFAMFLVIVGILLRRWSTAAEARTQGQRAAAGGAGITGALAFVCAALIIAWSTFKIIPAGHVGVTTFFGKVERTPLYEGYTFVNPLLDVRIMTIQVQKHDAKYDAGTKDLQQVHIKMTLNFRLLADKAPDVFQRVGPNYVSVIVEPAAQEVLKANTALHNVSEILQERQRIKIDVQKGLGDWLSRYGIDLREVAIADVTFEEEYSRAILRKQVAEQDLLTAQRVAAAKVVTARGDGEAARERARGDAEALKIKGEAEASYNQRVAASLTPTLIQQQYLIRWDGKLPQYQLGGGSGVLFQIPAGSGGK